MSTRTISNIFICIGVALITIGASVGLSIVWATDPAGGAAATVLVGISLVIVGQIPR